MYITTAGVGLIPAGRELAAARVAVGDVVLASGTMGDHGTAVMLARGDLALEADIESDTAPLHELVEDLLAAAPDTRWLRDSTARRGGHRLQRAGPRRGRDGRARGGVAARAPCRRGRLRTARDRPSLRGQRGKAHRGGASRAGARGARGHAAPTRRGPKPCGWAPSRPSRPGSSCCGPPWAAPGSSTCSSATRCRASADPADPAGALSAPLTAAPCHAVGTPPRWRHGDTLRRTNATQRGVEVNVGDGSGKAGPRPARPHSSTRGAHHCVEWASVRSRMPRVARNADSGITGKMLASFHCGSMPDQS